MTTRFVVCGETLIDLIPADEQPTGYSRSVWQACSAGGPMNSAVALGKLGSDSHFLGRLSTDSFGAQLRGHIEQAGVALDLAIESLQPTSLAVVSLDAEGKASYTFHFNDTANFGWQEIDLPDLEETDWLHIASLAGVVAPGNEVLVQWAKHEPCGISYDINVRPTVITDPAFYWEKVRPWIRIVGKHHGILKASDEDIEFLRFGRKAGQDPIAVMTRWVQKYGCSLGVVTLGKDGVAGVEPDGTVTMVPGFPADLVDTVGAGDTCMAGFLDAYVRQGLDLRASLTRGAAAAAIVCSRRGAQPPTAAEVDALIAAEGR